MRKVKASTSQDGGDSTSITSGLENEIKKSGAIIKTKRNSIKRKVQNFSNESDDAVIEPLLQKDKEKTDTSKHSAKFNLLSKNKTDTTSEKGSDTDKLISDVKLQKSTLSNVSDSANMLATSSKLTSINAPLHNHMNTNVFNSQDTLKGFVAAKSHILVELDGSKQAGYSPTPLIFTTAKIHTDGKTKHMEPVQMTPAPILSTTEVNLNTGNNKSETSESISSNINKINVNIPNNNINISQQEKPPSKTVSKEVDTKILISADKTATSSNKLDKSSVLSSITTKEIKLNQSKFTHNNVEDISTGNKKDKEENQTIAPVLELSNLSSSDKNNTSIPYEMKAVPVSPAATKATSSNNYIKDGRVIDHSVAITKDKTEAPKYPETKTDLNKKVMSDSLESQSKASNNVKLQSNAQNPSDITRTSSISGRQLQRQNIVIDKEDPTSKSKQIIASSLINDTKVLQISGGSQKASVVEVNKLSDNKTKLPKPSANSVPITTSVTTMSINASVVDSKTSISKKYVPITVTTASVTASAAANLSNTASIKKAPEKKVDKSFVSIAATASDSKASSIISATLPINRTSATTPIPLNIPLTNKSFSPSTPTATDNKTVASNNTTVPITANAATNKTSVSITTTAITTKISAPINSTAATKKTSASITTTSAPTKISVPIVTTEAMTKKSVSITTTTATTKITTPISTTAANTKKPASIATTVATTKTFAPITSPAATTKTSAPLTMNAPIAKTSAPITTTAVTTKTSASITKTASTTKTSGPITTTVATTKIPTSKAITTAKATEKISILNRTTLPISSNTAITSSDSEPLSTGKYSANNASNLSGQLTSASSASKSEVTSKTNTKPSGSIVSTNSTRKSAVATHTTTSPSTRVADLPMRTTTASQGTVEKLTENITNKTKLSTGNSNAASTSSNITAAVTTTAPISIAPGSSLNTAVSKIQNDLKSNELSNGNKNFKA